jgi:hypothetical protein
VGETAQAVALEGATAQIGKSNLAVPTKVAPARVTPVEYLPHRADVETLVLARTADGGDVLGSVDSYGRGMVAQVPSLLHRTQHLHASRVLRAEQAGMMLPIDTRNTPPSGDAETSYQLLELIRSLFSLALSAKSFKFGISVHPE